MRCYGGERTREIKSRWCTTDAYEYYTERRWMRSRCAYLDTEDAQVLESPHFARVIPRAKRQMVAPLAGESFSAFTYGLSPYSLDVTTRNPPSPNMIIFGATFPLICSPSVDRQVDICHSVSNKHRMNHPFARKNPVSSARIRLLLYSKCT